MKPFIRLALERQAQRLQELDAQLAHESATADLARFRRLTREHAELSEVVDLYRAHRRRSQELADAQALSSDAEMAELARDEVVRASDDIDELNLRIQSALLPKDPDDARNVFLEIRAGTGGDESALFAGDLLRMYLRYAERVGLGSELISASSSELGGYKEVVVRISGEGAYGRLRFESGGHRVQRVPATESQGRVHTSACTVAVMPEADEAAAVDLNPADLRIDTYRASGAGGQHVNKTDSAVRITHLPSGVVAECQDDRSQHRNRAKAMQVLLARLQARQRQARELAEAAARKGLIGSGDRSDRIRTYNFPQGRVSDHRINLTLYKLAAVMEGDLDELIHPLQLARGTQLLQELQQQLA